MMDIACVLLKTDGTFKKALLPEELALDLIKKLREEGQQYVGFKDEGIMCEGIFIPAKNIKHGIMAIPNIEGDDIDK